ncbi:SPOR domain-containing protein [Paraferrimonas sedimenticola]|uniref:Cell division protein FtsN n=1 Tax=Paraferrimonas sedimenticola TaxID=375674 RepID=A0AA37RYE3_9GAMM|nr:SPOR domain-containing protein [Paraferrimonas sedimenticola]GLP97426.1 cell division protein FtsN [Paraferrimonas sedimenticola]
MSQRDYANRGRPKKKKPSTRNKPARAAAKPAAWLKIAPAVVLIAGFGYFLYQISGSADDPSIATKPDPIVLPSKPKSNAGSDNLPPKPQENWDYLDQLPQKSVEVDLPEKTEPGRPYQMQCGSFRNSDDAQAMRATIAFQGLEAEVKRTESQKNGIWYRVRLGPYDSKRQAERDRHKLQRAGMNGCQIWYWT